MLCMELWKFKESTAATFDIQDICWDPNGENFAIATMTTIDDYNRSGNLMIGSTETLKIKAMDAHTEMRPLAELTVVLDDHIYATVSQVRFSLTGDYLNFLEAMKNQFGPGLSARRSMTFEAIARLS
ncbi:hypothetical protein RUND412_003246 [Rhizina undulata]